MTLTPDQLVAREVHYCVSFLVSTLAAGDGAIIGDRASMRRGNLENLQALAEQAMELCSPIDDWEEAATDGGWRPNPNGGGWWWKDENGHESAPSAQDACEANDIEPYQREVFEHWIVSDWLADRLAEKGEKVDKDFAGMTIWARTTSGQGIASDSVIEAICADLNAKA